MLPTPVKLDLLFNLQSQICTPEKNFFVRNEECFRICYSIDNKIKYIHIIKGMEAADFLKKFGKITHRAYMPDNVKMYTTSYYMEGGYKGKPDMKPRLVPFYWSDIDFTEQEAHFIASVYEYEDAVRQCGHPVEKVIGKVVKMINNVSIAA